MMGGNNMDPNFYKNNAFDRVQVGLNLLVNYIDELEFLNARLE